MRYFSLLVLLIGSVAAFPQKEEPNKNTTSTSRPAPLETLLGSSQYEDFTDEDDYHDRIEILRKAFETKATILESQIRAERFDFAEDLMRQLRDLAYYTTRESVEEKDTGELRDREVKRLEIELRRLVEQLYDFGLLVPFNERRPFTETRAVLEELRNLLLKQIFGEVFAPIQGASRFSDRPISISGQPVDGMITRTNFISAPAPAVQRGLAGLDRFTEEEFSKVQLAQKLENRVEVFLEIAEARLDEIERREAGKEWDEEEPNPLEFFTYEDMLFGYSRAIRGVMINIDERARGRGAENDDIRDALEKLSEKIGEFIPRLEKIKEVVIAKKDEALARQWKEASKTSDQAQKGALYGLGAPTGE